MTLQWIKNLLLLMLNLFPIIITLLNLFLLISFSLLSFNNSSYISFIIILILFSYIELSFLLSCIVKPCSLEDYQILPSYRINEISLTSCKNIILNQKIIYFILFESFSKSFTITLLTLKTFFNDAIIILISFNSFLTLITLKLSL